MITADKPNLQKGDKVIIKPSEPVNDKWYIREIYEPFPRESKNFGYWKCISCKYQNMFGNIELKVE